MRIVRTHPATSTAPTRPSAGGPRARGLGGRRVIVLAGLLALLLALAGGSSAHAGTITVWSCHKPDGAVAPLDHWSSSITSAPGLDAYNDCAATSGLAVFGATANSGSYPAGQWATWTFSAPSSTSVQSISYTRVASLGGQSAFALLSGRSNAWDRTHIRESCETADGCTLLNWTTKTFPFSDDDGLQLYIEPCGGGGSCTNTWALFQVSRAAVVLRDSSTPTVSNLSGPLVADQTLSGDASLAFQATDTGTGVYRLHLLVDGSERAAHVLNDNGGRCAPVDGPRDFVYAVPCPLSASASETLDTTALADGTHLLDVQVEDAAGNLVTVTHRQITTYNAPGMVDRPALSGTAKIESQLSGSTGSWSRSPTGYAYQWSRCPSSVTSPAQADSCTVIPGATSATYEATAADVYGRLMLRVTASNANGSTEAFSAPSSVVLDAQGRASAPAPSDGGPRDVVVVPVGPGGSSTTIIGGSSTGPSYSIVGLKNPLADQAGHVPNGTNAAAGARIKVAFAARQNGRARESRVVRSTRNRRWVVKGQVVNPAGKPIGGAQLVTAWQMPGGSWIAHTGVTTRADGSFTYVLSKGPSRKLRFVYFAFSDATAYNASNVLEEKVATPVKLRVAPRAARNGRSVKFTGTVGTDFMPKAGVLVTLQARYPGGGWKQFATARTSAGGRFTTTYRFTRTTTSTRYAFRARVAKQTGYPFEGGASRPVEVLVTP